MGIEIVFWLVNELRNHSVHRSMILRHIAMNITENVNTGESNNDRPRVYFLIDDGDGKRIPTQQEVMVILQESQIIGSS